ncbi:MAG: biosynthetic-type acetolactate synthase large subunit [Solirubrobacterales bacterium]
MNGAQILLACLKEQGVDMVFGYPGGAVIPLYNALYDEKNINHIRTAHEQGAVHAADGYARSTGKVGVCFATSGPGATNTITGIATAFMDSVPMIVITGQVTVPLLGRDSFQEIDITGITLSVTKHNYLVRNVNNLADTVREAFKVAKSGRPGPVLIDIPKNLFMEEGLYEKKPALMLKEEKTSYDENDFTKALELINKSKKPVIYAGGGVKIADASKELFDFAVKTDTPVVNSLMGLGSVPYNSDLRFGMVGMHGFREANLAVTNSDLIIAIGARFSDRVISKAESFAPNAKIIHIDADATEIGKNVRVDISLLGNLKETVKKLTEQVDKKHNVEWKNQINAWKKPEEKNKDIFYSKNILDCLCDKFGPEAFVVTDVGQHQMWTAQHWKFNFPRALITSGGLGTMGFGMGAAIGAKVGNMDKPVVLITGDGSYRMNCNELATVAGHNIPIVIVLFNNSTLGMVRQWQKMFSGRRYSETNVDNCLDYVKLAEAYGIEGHRAGSMKELRDIMNNCKFGGKPVFIECTLDKDENVYPIVPPGKAINESIEEFDN